MPEVDAARARTIADHLAAIRLRMTRACAQSDRPPDQVVLTCVTKTVGAEDIACSLDLGERHFGENRVQEAQSKWPMLKIRYPDAELRLIGPLQSNKAADAIRLFDVIETIDREKIARIVADEIQRAGRRPRLFVQVNTGAEPQKAGVAPQEADAFLRFCSHDLGLTIDGLMCIPPANQHASPHFALLRKIAERNGLTQLSMGMSEDFERAIQSGATHIRVGSALFGARPHQQHTASNVL